MATGLDCGWDTSDDECGMQIDLDNQAEDNEELNLGEEGVLENGEHQSPTASTGNCDQTRSTHSELSNTEQTAVKNCENISTIVDEGASFVLTPPSGDNEKLKTGLTDGEGMCLVQAKIVQSGECSDGENNGGWSSEMCQNQNGCSSSHGGENTPSEPTSCLSPDDYIEQADEGVNNGGGIINSLSERKSSGKTEYNIRSPSDSLKTDEDTQNSIYVDSDVSNVPADVSNFQGRKESLRKSVESDEAESSCKEEEDQVHGRLSDKLEDSMIKKRRRHVKERETLRRQEEVNACNEQVMVNLCRAESGSDRIEEDVSKPKKKARRKGTGKKIRKKEKKLKKNKSKKIKSKLKDGAIERDHRFVEIREDRTSVESKEDGELNGEVGNGNLVYRKSSEERVPVDVYEPVLGENTGDELDGEQREPGEIVEEKKKRNRKDRNVKKKKKRRRRVATIEEGSQEDGDVQKFPTFLDGFFVQNEEGEEEFDNGSDGLLRSFDNEAQTFHTGDSVYRRRHSSELRDSIQSFDHINSYNRSIDSRSGESEHRRSRRQDENGHESRGRRHHGNEHSHDVRHEQDRHFDSLRVRGRMHGWDRERSWIERDRERSRDNGRDARARDREHERDSNLTFFRDRDRKRADLDERRRQQNRSNSNDNRLRFSTAVRVSQTLSRGSSSRHRHRTRSRERSSDRDRERDKERSKNRNQNRSPEREPARRVILSSHFQSQSPQNMNGKTSSDKENREERHRAEKVSELNARDNGHHGARRQRKDRGRRKSSSSSSTSSSDDCVITYRNRNIFHRHHSSDDDGSSSDVILVESERVVINLVDEEDPPSRVDMTTQTITEDSSTRVMEAASTSPLVVPENPVDKALTEIIHTAPVVVDVIDKPDLHEDIAAAPIEDKPTKAVETQQSDSLMKESDYDPAHPTEEAEEFEIRPTTPKLTVNPFAPTVIRPEPPDHPPPAEARPSLPPVPASMDAAPVIFQSQPLPHFASPRPQMTLSSTFQEQLRPPLQHLPPMQHLPPLQPFPGVEQGQRFPSQPGVNGTNFNNLQQNNGLHQAFPSAQLGIRPIPDIRPMFPPQPSSMPFRSPLLNRPHLAPPRDMQQMNIQYRMPMSTLAPHVRLPLVSFEKSKMPTSRFDNSMAQPCQLFRPPPPMTSLQSSNMPLYNNPLPSRGLGCDLMESTEEVDMDMSPREDNYGMEFLSPSSSDSEVDNNRKRRRKPDSQVGSSADKLKPSSSTGKGTAAVQNDTFSKDVNKLLAKGKLSSTSQKSKPQPARKRRIEASDDDLDDEDDVPTSAVDLTNKEKYMKKLHFQERVIDEVKMAIKPFYNSKKITKEQYKVILRKAVPKVCHSKSGNINPQRILHLVEAYVRKIIRGRASGGGSKKRKQHAHGLKDTTNPASLRQNGGRGTNVTR